MRRDPPVLAALALLGLLAGMPGARAGCREAWDAVQTAIARQDVDGVRRAWDTERPDAVCTDAAIWRELKSDAMEFYLTAGFAAQRRGDAATAQAMVDRAEQWHGSNWRLQELKGELAHARRDFQTSAIAYQNAFDDARRPGRSGGAPPSAAQAERLYRRMVEARQLAATLVPAPRRSDGGFGGPYGGRISVEAAPGPGVQMTTIPAPIQFDFDSATVETAKDVAAAAEVCEFLHFQAGKHLPTDGVLIGHTDRAGSDAYNDDLSRRRADAVRSYLITHDCGNPTLRVEGHGRREPLPLSDPSLYGPGDIDRLNRRVELVLP